MKTFTLIILCFTFFLISRTENVKRNVSPRIIGGIVVPAGQMPFSAAITTTTPSGRYFCGGTLISSLWILTAGQCVDQATSFTIQLGSNQLTGDDPNRVTVSSSEYILHPDYNSQTLENDVGLIKLRLAVEFSTYLKEVDVLGSYHVNAGVHLMAIGWGQTSDDDSANSNDLMKAYVTSLSSDECKQVYGNQITDNTVCIEGNYNEGSCYGDTGSALVQDLGRGYIMHVGIASFVSGNGCESTDPSGYIRTFPYRAWILNVTRS